MVVFNFTLSEDGVAVLHDALACMFKFSDDVCLEARKDKLTLTTLNISKSAYVCYSFAANRFFSRYSFEGTPQQRDKFSCQLYIKSLLTIFRARQSGGASESRDGTSSIERCDVAIDDGDGKKSRLVARVSFRNGITASHSLPYEVKAPVHAKFNKEEASNHWTISSKTLRQLMDHFGPGIELLDINTNEDNRVVNFTCFTEKVQKRSGNDGEVLKKPLHTNIAVEMDEFDDVEVEDKLHIIISVKDFRAILQHAQITSGELVTTYSNPGRPMKLSYGADGILCEFILMTIGEKDAMSQKHKAPRSSAAKAAAAPAQLDAASYRANSGTNSTNPQPIASNTAPKAKPSQHQSQDQSRHPGFEIRPQNPPPGTSRSTRSDSLFVGQYDDDQQWEPVNPEEEEEEEDNARLEWNTNSEPNPSSMRISSYVDKGPVAAPEDDDPDHPASGLEPTQRLSQVRRFGLFSP